MPDTDNVPSMVCILQHYYRPEGKNGYWDGCSLLLKCMVHPRPDDELASQHMGMGLY